MKPFVSYKPKCLMGHFVPRALCLMGHFFSKTPLPQRPIRQQNYNYFTYSTYFLLVAFIINLPTKPFVSNRSIAFVNYLLRILLTQASTAHKTTHGKTAIACLYQANTQRKSHYLR